MAFQIEQIVLRKIRMPLVHFFETSFGRTYEREMVLVEVRAGGVSGWGEVTCGECEFGYDDDGSDGCLRNACTLARTDSYEPDGYLTEVPGTLGSQPMTWLRSLSAGESDWFRLRVEPNCAATLTWTHEGPAGGATFEVWSPQYGAATKHAMGEFSPDGTATIPGTVPAGFLIDYEVHITSTTLCASYSFTATMSCPCVAARCTKRSALQRLSVGGHSEGPAGADRKSVV